MTRRGAFLLTLAILLGPHAALGQPDDKQACTDAYVANQKLRKDGKLTLAREQLLLCAQEACPGPIKADCVKWLGDLEQNIPTVVIDAKDREGRDTTAVRVLVDGQKVAEKLDGRPLAIDPGEHTLRFEYDGADPIEQRIVVQQGAKNRSMSVSFATASATVPEPAKNGDTPTPATPDDGPPVHWAVVAVIGVLSLGAFATFAGFGVTGKQDADELDRTCGENAEDPNLRRTCTDEQIEDVRTKLIVADVMLGVGVATAAVAIGLLIWNVAADSSSTAVEVHLAPTVGGAYGGVGLRF
jgi:hypothetical protein